MAETIVYTAPLHVRMAQRLRQAGISTPAEAGTLSITTRDRIVGGTPRFFGGALIPTWGGTEDEAWEKALELLDRGPIPLLDRADLHVREWMPNRAEGDVGPMYVIECLGLCLIVREKDDVVYVHIDTDTGTEATRPGLSIGVEVNNNGEVIHGRG